MKKKRILSSMLVAVMLITSNPANITAQGNNEAMVGNLSTAKISVDGGETVTIQSYNVGGYNYVRAREITDILNMDITGDSEGVMLKPYNAAETNGALEKLLDEKITANMKNGYIHYSGYDSIETKFFNYKNRNYFKLADLAQAAQNHKESRLEIVPVFSSPPVDEQMKIFKVDWDQATSTVIITTETIDLLKHYNEARGIVPPETKNDPNPQSDINTTPQQPEKPTDHTVLPEYQSADEIPKFPAKIMVDESKGAEISNLTYPYRLTGLYGECTWYAIGRFYEVFGIDIAHDENAVYGYGNWVSEAMSGKYPNIDGIPYLGNGDLSNIPDRGIAEWKGHVVFIEYVERDATGKPIKIYYTEANAGTAADLAGYNPEYDGRIKSSNSLSGFLTASGEKNFVGFIVPKDK